MAVRTALEKAALADIVAGSSCDSDGTDGPLDGALQAASFNAQLLLVVTVVPAVVLSGRKSSAPLVTVNPLPW